MHPFIAFQTFRERDANDSAISVRFQFLSFFYLYTHTDYTSTKYLIRMVGGLALMKVVLVLVGVVLKDSLGGTTF